MNGWQHTLIIGCVFMPVYLKNKIFTMPQFLRQRYNANVAMIICVLVAAHGEPFVHSLFWRGCHFRYHGLEFHVLCFYPRCFLFAIGE